LVNGPDLPLPLSPPGETVEPPHPSERLTDASVPGGPAARRHGPPPPRRSSPRHPLLLVAGQGLAEGRGPSAGGRPSPSPQGRGAPPEHLTQQHTECYPGTGCPTTPPSIIIRLGGIEGWGGGRMRPPTQLVQPVGCLSASGLISLALIQKGPATGPPPSVAPEPAARPHRSPAPLFRLSPHSGTVLLLYLLRVFFGVRRYGT